MKLLKALLIYAAASLMYLGIDGREAAPEPTMPALPVEAGLVPVGAARDFCGSDFLAASLGAGAFRWVYRQAERPALWNRGLIVLCEELPEKLVRINVLSGGKPVFATTYERRGGFDGDNVTARVIARLLAAQPAVISASLEAYLGNQADVARAAADLWRAKRWRLAADHLSLALENRWPEESQADLHFGLADTYAHLGKPRQAFWHALAYMHASRKPPPQAWIKGLRGVAGLIAQQPANVEPVAEESARRWRQAAQGRRWDEALSALRRLTQEAPWAPEYQDAVAATYERLGWRALGEAWRLRAARTRLIGADEELQQRLAELTR